MTDWTMVVETWPDGQHSFPKFTRDGPRGPKRFVTTVQSVRATEGEFIYEDHGTPWSTVARNLEVVVTRRRDLRRHGALHERHGGDPELPADARRHDVALHDRGRARAVQRS